jgi:hypothetical protein
MDEREQVVNLKIVTQTDSIEKGGWMDDCAPSTLMAAANFLTGSTYTSKDGIKFLEKVGRKDVQGQGTPTTLPQLVKAAPLVGLKPKYAKSWDEVVAALKAGAVVGINVQQAKGYPATVQMSAWHKAHQKRNPGKTYGHMTCAAMVEGKVQWADPTMSGKGKETYAVEVSLADLKVIASSKGEAPHKRCLIFTAVQKKSSEPAPTAVLSSQIVPVSSSALVATTLAAQTTSKAPVEADLRHAEAFKTATKVKTAPQQVDTALALEVARALVGKIEVAKGDKTMKDQLIAAGLDALQAALSTAIAVFLGLGVSIFDLTGDGAKAIAASAISAALLVLQRWLDEDNTRYGRTR